MMNDKNFSISDEGVKKMNEQVQNWATSFFDQFSEMKQGDHGTPDGTKRINSMMQEGFSKLMTNDPIEEWTSQVKLWQEYSNIWQQTFFGGSAKEDDKKKDRRFSSDLWSDQPVFDFIKKCYLTTAESIQERVKNIEGLDEKTNREVAFYMDQYINAMSPSNFALTNPDVIKETIDTQGQNLVKGFENMMADLKRNEGSGVLNIKMTDFDQFTIGENIAITPGKVVFENKLFQLIKYSPQTKKVHEVPLLIVPPFLNKYYILDLNEKKSFVDWVVKQGYTVFMISWVNPDASFKDMKFEQYMTDGIIPAAELASAISGQEEINVIGYCIGGTVLAPTLAYLKAKKRKLFKSVTYFTCLLDFEDPGELGVFLSDDQVSELEKEMAEVGYLDGRRLAATFNLLRSNDLIWSYFVDHYLCGKEPFPFDLLYWNSDSVNIAGASHGYYLREMYLNNKLCKPGGLNFDGVDIDLTTVNIPTIFISAEKDHIAPWEATYSGAKLCSGETEFVLGGSGHIAGIVNPPEKMKYGFKTNKTLAETPQEWLESSTEHTGSWWLYWEKWLKKQSGNLIDAKNLGNRKYKAIEDAPGRYVKASILDNAKK